MEVEEKQKQEKESEEEGMEVEETVRHFRGRMGAYAGEGHVGQCD